MHSNLTCVVVPANGGANVCIRRMRYVLYTSIKYAQRNMAAVDLFNGHIV